MFEVNNRSIICRSGVFILYFEYIRHIGVVFFFFLADLRHKAEWNTLLPYLISS